MPSPPELPLSAGAEVAGSDEAAEAALPGLVSEALSVELPHAASRSVEASPAAVARTMRCRITEFSFAGSFFYLRP